MKKRTLLIAALAVSIALFFVSNALGWTVCGAPVRSILKGIPILILLFGTLDSMLGESVPEMKRQMGLGICALSFSFLGDIGGDLSCLGGTTSFLLMMGFFLVAQVFYAVRAAGLRDRDKYQWGLILPLLAYAVCVGYMILRGAGNGPMAYGVAAYMIVLTSVGYFTFRSKLELKWVVAIGAALFIISDSIIAVNKFVTPVPGREWNVMATYYAGQILLNWRYAR